METQYEFFLRHEHFWTELENSIKSIIENNKNLSHCKEWEIIKRRTKETSRKVAKEIRNKKKDQVKSKTEEICEKLKVWKI